jgi:hypothetical protein
MYIKSAHSFVHNVTLNVVTIDYQYHHSTWIIGAVGPCVVESFELGPQVAPCES